jgi:hypothetical protein
MKAAVFALVIIGASAAKCSDDDKNKISAMPGGDSAGSFPSLCAQAGKDSYSIFSGFNEDTFAQEVSQKIGVSKDCASCYGDAAKYGADNCKSACIFSWCSQGCLDCSASQKATVDACAGFTSPQPTVCGSGNAKVVSGKHVSQNSSFCEIIADDLPSECACKDKDLGGSVNCNVKVEKDAIGVQLDVMPCDPEAAHVDIAVTEATHNISWQVAGVKAGDEENYPIPGLSVDIPKVGSVGLDLSAEVDGDLDNLRMEIGFNACAKLLGHEVCGSELTSDLPLWLIKGSYRFGNLCKELRKEAASIVVV